MMTSCNMSFWLYFRGGCFSPTTKVFFYTDVKFRPQKASDSDNYYVLPSQLPPMISSVESKLGKVCVCVCVCVGGGGGGGGGG